VSGFDANHLDGFNAAYGPEFKFHNENLAILSWYVERMLTTLRKARAASLLSLGIGHTVVSRRVLSQVGSGIDSYTIVEGSAARIAELLAEGPLPAGARVVQAFFEDFEPDTKVDGIEMGFVLEHVEDPGLVLRRFAGFLRPGGILIAVVPNARALHRLVGQRAGLLPDPYQLSDYDRALGHRRYFDLESFTELVRSSGLSVRKAEGVFLKCLTTAQLESLGLRPEVMRAFFEVGVDYPEIANALYLETTPL
jgi:SAM-dependent methyltransferase